MPTRYVGNVGWLEDWKAAQTAVVRLDENLGRVDDALARIVSNNVLNPLDAPGEEGTALKINKNLRMKDCKRIYWAAAGVNEVAQRLAGYRFCTTAGGWEWDMGVSAGVKMCLSTAGRLGLGVGAAANITSGYRMDIKDPNGSGEGVIIRPSTSTKFTWSTSDSQAQFTLAGSGGATNAYCQWSLTDNAVDGSRTYVWGTKMRKDTSNAQTSGYSIEVGEVAGGTFRSCLYINLNGQMCLADAALLNALANPRLSGYVLSIAPTGAGSGSLRLRASTASPADLIRFEDGSGTGISSYTSTHRLGLATNAPLNRLDVNGAVAVGVSYAGGFTAPSNGAIIEGAVAIGDSANTQSKLRIVPGTDLQGIIIAGQTTSTNNFPGINTSVTWSDTNSDTTGHWLAQITESGSNHATRRAIQIKVGGTERFAVDQKGTTTISTNTNVNGLSIVGGALTGSNTQTLTNITQTWSTSGVPTAFFQNIIPSSYTGGTGAMLYDWQYNSVSVSNCSIDGLLTQTGRLRVNSTGGDVASFYLTGTSGTRQNTVIGIGGSGLSNNNTFQIYQNLLFDLTRLNSASGKPWNYVFGADLTSNNWAAEANNVRGITSDLKLGGANGFTYPSIANFEAIWGNDDGNQNYGMSNYTNWYGFWIHDDTGAPWDFTGGGSAPTHQYGILIEATGSGTSDYHGIALDANINFTDNSYIYWGSSAQTAVGSRSSGFRWNGASSIFEWSTGTTIRLTLGSAAMTLTDALNIAVGTSSGTIIGTATSQKIAFWGVTATAQYNTTGTATGFTGHGGTAVTHTDTFTGNTGATAYTIGDVVRALKLCGIMAA